MDWWSNMWIKKKMRVFTSCIFLIAVLSFQAKKTTYICTANICTQSYWKNKPVCFFLHLARTLLVLLRFKIPEGSTTWEHISSYPTLRQLLPVPLLFQNPQTHERWDGLNCRKPSWFSFTCQMSNNNPWRKRWYENYALIHSHSISSYFTGAKRKE